MAKRIRQAMVDFAKHIGAMRGGRPDWYRVAEALAAIAKPELMKGEAKDTHLGRPKNDDDFLAVEVQRVMWTFDVGVREACRRIARGYKVPLPTLPGKPPRWTVGSPWKGTKPGTLEQRYFRWWKLEQERQKKLTTEIM